MSHSKTLLRVAAVLSSITIFGLYLTHEVRRRSVLNAQTTAPAKVLAPATQPREMMISGSKSAVVFPSPSTQPVPVETTQPRQIMMSGSKSSNHVIDTGNVMFGDGHVAFEPTTNPGKP